MTIATKANPRALPADAALIVFDFDGVFTDNRVWVDEDGREHVAVSRSDGLGLSLLRERTDIAVLVLSKEKNPVVSARCRKLNVPCFQGVDDKAAMLNAILAERRISPDNTLYVGNDVNDLPCFPLVACAVVPSDAHPDVMGYADLVLTNRGGHGAIRELCDMLLRRLGK